MDWVGTTSSLLVENLWDLCFLCVQEKSNETERMLQDNSPCYLKFIKKIQNKITKMCLSPSSPESGGKGKHWNTSDLDVDSIA